MSSVIQRNKIHDPRWGSNSWAQNGDQGSKHPSGPQAISIGKAYEGNLVIRYNEFWSTEGHYFNDIIGLGDNSGYQGSPGPDSDIYGNYISSSFDDGLEVEGSGANVRIWENYITHTYLGIGNAVVSVGPLYIWRNVFGVSYSPRGSQYGEWAPVLKSGHAGNPDRWMTGYTYFFHDTILQPGKKGYGGLGVHDQNGSITRFLTSRNNILEVREEAKLVFSANKKNHTLDFDFDLFNRDYPNHPEHEKKGIKGTPTYKNQSFDLSTKTGNFELDSTSLGFDKGKNLPNFSGPFNGKAPDIGAHEHGLPPKVYGVLSQVR